MERIHRISLFESVLSLIQDDDIRNFTEQLLTDADDYFFTEAASSTGKYHPQYALGDGGLARHSIAVALILNDILNGDCYKFTSRQKDLLTCGAIVHDIKKYGTGKKFTTKDHPELASQYILEEQVENSLISKDDAKFISEAVKTHMGKWGNEKPQTDAQKLLHIADCLAAKRWLEVNFDKLQTPPQGKKIIQESPGDYVVPFGKYKGSKLSDVDPSYLDFLVNKFTYQEHPVVNKAKMLLKEINNKQ